MPRIDRDAIPFVSRTGYPPPLDAAVAGRFAQRLSGPGRLTQFGVNIVRLAPGAWSSHRHWHSREDEFAMMLGGELILVTEGREQVLRAGDCAAFPAGLADAHHLINRSDREASFLVVGTDIADDSCHYPDVDLHLPRNDGPFNDKAGKPYPSRRTASGR